MPGAGPAGAEALGGGRTVGGSSSPPPRCWGAGRPSPGQRVPASGPGPSDDGSQLVLRILNHLGPQTQGAR